MGTGKERSSGFLMNNISNNFVIRSLRTAAHSLPVPRVLAAQFGILFLGAWNTLGVDFD